MRKLALIGYPAAHSGSPALFHELCPGVGSYDIVETPSFEEAWKRFLDEFDAVNITAPFKEMAFRRASAEAEASGRPELISPEVRKIGAANIAVKCTDGIRLYNSDFLGVRKVLAKQCSGMKTLAVVGFGGAGKAAKAAAESLGFEVRIYHHDEIAEGLEADVVIYTLPCRVDGSDRLGCKILLEANYRNPSFPKGSLEARGTAYIPGTEWLRAQAEEGFPLMLEII